METCLIFAKLTATTALHTNVLLKGRQAAHSILGSQRRFGFLVSRKSNRIFRSRQSTGNVGPSALGALIREAGGKNLQDGSFWRNADRRLLFLASSMQPRALSAVAAALATARHRNTEVLERLAERCIEVKYDFEPFELALVLNAFARLRCRPNELLLEFAQMFRKSDSKIVYDARAIALTINALARFSFYDSVLMEALCHQAIRQVDGFSAQDVANTLNGLQRLNHLDQNVLLTLQVHCRKIAPALRPQHIANTLQSAAHFQVLDDLSIESVIREIPAKIESFSPQEVAACCSALAGLKSPHREATRTLLSYYLRHHCRFSPSQSAILLHAASRLAFVNNLTPQVFSAFAPRIEAEGSNFDLTTQAILLHAYAKTDPKAKTVFDILGQALANGPLLSSFQTSDAPDAMQGNVLGCSRTDIQPCEEGNPSEIIAFPKSDVRKLRIMVLQAFSKLGKRHNICDKILNILIAEVSTLEDATTASPQNAGHDNNQQVGGFKIVKEIDNEFDVLSPSTPTVAPCQLAASIAMAVVNLRAFDRQDALHAIAKSIVATNGSHLTPLHVVNILYAFEQNELHAGCGCAVYAVVPEFDSSILQGCVERLTSLALLHVKELSPQLLGSVSLSVARLVKTDALKHQFLEAVALEVPFLRVEGAEGMHAATALLAALVEGTPFSEPLASINVKTAITTLLQKCLEDLSAMPLPLFVRFTTSAVDAVTKCLFTLKELSLHTYAGERNSAIHTLETAPNRWMLHGQLGAAARLAGLDDNVVCKAIFNMEAEIVRRLDTANISAVLALANVVAAPRCYVSKRVGGHTVEKQGSSHSAEFLSIVQKFFPFVFLSPASQRRLAEYALPISACRNVYTLLDHWEEKSQCVLGTLLDKHTGSDPCVHHCDFTGINEHRDTFANSTDGGYTNAVNTSKEAPAAYFFVHEQTLTISEIPWLMKSSKSLVAPQWASTPTQLVQTLIELTKLATCGGNCSLVVRNCERFNGLLRLDPDTCSFQLLQGLLHAMHRGTEVFPVSDCATALRAVADAGLSDPHFIEKVVTSIALRNRGVEEFNEKDTRGSVTPNEMLASIPFEVLLDILHGASRGAITAETKASLLKIVQAHKKTLVERNDSYRAAEGLHRLNMLELPTLYAMLTHVVSRLQKCLLQFSSMNANVFIDLRPLSTCIKCLCSTASIACKTSVVVCSVVNPHSRALQSSENCIDVPDQNMVATAVSEWSMVLLPCLESAHCEGLVDFITSAISTQADRKLDFSGCPSISSARSALCFPELACVDMLSAFSEWSVAPSMAYMQYQAIGACLYFLGQCDPCNSSLAYRCTALRVLANLNMKGARLICDRILPFSENVMTSSSVGHSKKSKVLKAFEDLCREDVTTVSTMKGYSSVMVNSAEGPAASGKECNFADAISNVAARGYTILKQIQPYQKSLASHYLISAAFWCTSVSMLDDKLSTNGSKQARVITALTAKEIDAALLDFLSCISSRGINSSTIMPEDKLQLSLVLSYLRYDKPCAWKQLDESAQHILWKLSQS